MTKPGLRRMLVLMASLLLCGGRSLGQGKTGEGWVTAWGASPQTIGSVPISNATVRMIARVTADGNALRIRVDNTFGKSLLTIGQAYVGLRIQGAKLAAGSNRQVFFQGSTKVIVPAGGRVESDSVPIKVMAQQDLAVSLYIPEAGVLPSQHTRAQITSYLSENNSGDLAAVEDAKPFNGTTTAMLWLRAIDVLPASTSAVKGAVVAFGDSITDGTCSTVDAHDRWEDWMSVRLDINRESSRGNSRRGASQSSNWAVINEGIGGNMISGADFDTPPNSTPGVDRLDRDVLSHFGVTHVILFMGTNDIRRGASAAHVITAAKDIIERVHKRQIRIFGATVLPRQSPMSLNPSPASSGQGAKWDEAMTKIRQEVNRWIRTQAKFDAVIDFDEVIRDPANPEMMVPRFDCGDNVHPSPAGYYEMGKSIPLTLLEMSGRKPVRASE